MAEMSVLQRALSECWSAEVSGVTYYETFGERFPDHGDDADVLVLVEKTTRDLIEVVARSNEVTIDHDAAERTGRDAAQGGGDWREFCENALIFTPYTLQMFENLAAVLPEDQFELGQAVVEHERAQITLFESVVAGGPGDWSAIHAYLERHGASTTA